MRRDGIGVGLRMHILARGDYHFYIIPPDLYSTSKELHRDESAYCRIQVDLHWQDRGLCV